MANTAQARKRARQSEKRRQHNASLRSAFRSAIRKVRKAIDDRRQGRRDAPPERSLERARPDRRQEGDPQEHGRAQQEPPRRTHQGPRLTPPQVAEPAAGHVSEPVEGPLLKHSRPPSPRPSGRARRPFAPAARASRRRPSPVRKPVSRVLVINDEPLVLREFVKGLNAAARSLDNPLGLTFTGVTTAREALEALEQDGDVQAVVVDDKLYNLNGKSSTTARRCRRSSWCSGSRASGPRSTCTSWSRRSTRTRSSTRCSPSRSTATSTARSATTAACTAS